MTSTHQDPERLPVVIASGQSIERDALVTPLDLMHQACERALGPVARLASRIDRLSVVDVMGRTGPALASELAARLPIEPTRMEVTTIGGNSPQWLVNRAASDIAAGRLRATVIAGAEAIRSSRARRAAGLPPELGATSLAPDPVVGDDKPGVGPAEVAIGLLAPVHIYPLFESVLAARAGRDSPAHRRALGELLAPFTTVAAANPFAWFARERTAEELATPSADNRVVCEPYTKLMTAFLGSDQGAALVVCSLAEARRIGAAERAVFVWSGAEANDVRSPTARPDPGRSPAIAAAARALFDAGGRAAGGERRLGVDDVSVLDLYSCFPSAVELALEALGIAGDDHRGLTVTGGLPYFGGPGNNYTTHAIAEVTDRLRGSAGGGATAWPRLGLVSGLGWFVTKHALGLYGTSPPPGGFHFGDTTSAQEAIDASALEIALEVDAPQRARVVAATVVRDGAGAPTDAPALVDLDDGRRMAVGPVDAETAVAVAEHDVVTLVGTSVEIASGPARYRLATR